jgi:trimeric autotransporter adhesin
MNTRCISKNLFRILSILVLGAIFAGLTLGNVPTQPVSAAPLVSQSRPLSELLNPDGSIVLDSGYRGTLDLQGWKLISDAGAAPRFAPLAVGDGHWDNIFGRIGLSNTVYALVMDGTNLYVGGNFTAAGNVIANYIAMWDGSAWSSVGGGLNGQVNALAIGPNDGYLYVGGSFQNAGNNPNADRIAVWDGAAWQALGTGFNNVVSSLVFDGSGNLYAGGTFTNPGLSRVALWDGSTWNALGTGIANGGVNALAIDGSNHLYAGGSFTDAVGDMDYIGMWDGSTWSAVGTGLSSTVYALAASGGNNIYVGGSFIDAGGVASADRVALWSGSAWSALGSGIANNSVYTLVVDGSSLHVGGNFDNAGGVATADKIATWDGANWQSHANGVNGAVRALAVSSPGFFAAGDFTAADTVVTDRIAKWNGSAWLTVGTGKGTSGQVKAVALDGTGNLYVGGSFEYVGTLAASNIAKWNGSSWSILTSGTTGAVNALLFDAVNGTLYVGGSFNQAGGFTVNNIAIWDGSAWSALGTGVTGGGVFALTIGDDNYIYVGGAFTTAGGAPALRVARWDGAVWSALGDGLDNQVNALVPDGNGNIYAGGNFQNSGTTQVWRLGMWDGSTWSQVDVGLNNQVFALLPDGSGNLYVGGAFTDAGGNTSADRIAIWDGAAWTALGSGVNNNVRAMTMDVNGTLIVGGEFVNAGGVPANRIARWYQGAWYALGSGLNQPVYTITTENASSMFVGGNFTTAGDKAQNYLAHWSNSQPTAVDDSYNTPEETTLIVPAPGVLENDTDPNGDLLNATLVISPSSGTVSLSLDGSFIYTPTLNFSGSDTYTYLASDGYGGTDTAVVTIIVEPSNDAPVAVDDNVFTLEDTPVSIPVLANDYDPDGDTLSVIAVTDPLNGTAVISGTTEVLYTPDPAFSGVDSFDYVVSDGVLTDTGTVSVTVAFINYPPVAVDDNYSMAEDTTLIVPAPGVLSNDTDVEHEPLIAILVTQPTHGDLTFSSDGSFTYIPDTNYFGQESFTYKANDGVDSNIATVFITITPVQDAPVAVPDTYYALINSSLMVSAPGVLRNDYDPDGDPLTAQLTVPTTHGTVSLLSNGSFIYIPDADYLGTDTFIYSASDGNGGVATATVTILVVEQLPAQPTYLPLIVKLH